VWPVVSEDTEKKGGSSSSPGAYLIPIQITKYITGLNRMSIFSIQSKQMDFSARMNRYLVMTDIYTDNS
jgi:hypothetical protein